MAEQDQNRNEAATPHKKEEARKKGSVAKSLDINSFVVLAVVLISLYIWGNKIIDAELLLTQGILVNASHISFEINDVSSYLTGILSQSLILMTPFLLLLFLLSVLANFLQTGPVFSFFPLKPDLSRINPITGLKRLFSMRLLMESVKTVLKFILLGLVLYYAIKAVIPKLLISFYVMPSSVGMVLMPELTSMLAKLLAALAIVAALDLILTRWEYAKRLRMSRRDITDEHKRREGDPRVKSRLRELQREALKRAKSLGKVKDADVLITNPTHIAVAIKYQQDEMEAPMVIAKGAGFLAQRMKAIAKKNNVPIAENKALARSLFHEVEIERAVPIIHYTVIAKLLFWAYSFKRAGIHN